MMKPIGESEEGLSAYFQDAVRRTERVRHVRGRRIAFPASVDQKTVLVASRLQLQTRGPAAPFSFFERRFLPVVKRTGERDRLSVGSENAQLHRFILNLNI